MDSVFQFVTDTFPVLRPLIQYVGLDLLLWAGGVAALLYGGKCLLALHQAKQAPDREATFPEMLNFKSTSKPAKQLRKSQGRPKQAPHCLRYSQLLVRQEEGLNPGEWLPRVTIWTGQDHTMTLYFQIPDWKEGTKLDLQWVLMQLFETPEKREIKLLKCSGLDDYGREAYHFHLRQGNYSLEVLDRESYPEKFFGPSFLTPFFVYNHDESLEHPKPLGEKLFPRCLSFKNLKVSWMPHQINGSRVSIDFQGQAERERFSLLFKWNRPENPYINLDLSHFIESLFQGGEHPDYTILAVRYRTEQFSEVVLQRVGQGYSAEFKPCGAAHCTARGNPPKFTVVDGDRVLSIAGCSA